MLAPINGNKDKILFRFPPWHPAANLSLWNQRTEKNITRQDSRCATSTIIIWCSARYTKHTSNNGEWRGRLKCTMEHDTSHYIYTSSQTWDSWWQRIALWWSSDAPSPAYRRVNQSLVWKWRAKMRKEYLESNSAVGAILGVCLDSSWYARMASIKLFIALFPPDLVYICCLRSQRMLFLP